MTDRELLEAAAKAAGFRVHSWVVDDPYVIDTKSGLCDIWSPLDDDGDALRLAVRLDIVPRVINGTAFAWRDGVCDAQEQVAVDPLAATRRAIVRAAAAIGAAK